MKRCIAFAWPWGRHLSHRLRGRRHRGGLLCEASGIRPDTVLLSVDGRDVSAQRYLYWLAYACDYIADYYDSGEGIQWGTLSPARAWRITPRTRRCRTPPCTPQWRPGRRITAAPSPTRDRTAMDREWAARAAQYGGEGGLSGRAGPHGAGPGGSGGHLRGLLSLRAPVRPLLHGRAARLALRSMTWRPLPRSRATSPWTTSGSPPPLWTRRTREAVAACRAKAEEAFQAERQRGPCPRLCRPGRHLQR